MNTIKKSELTRFFDIISENKLDSGKKVSDYVMNVEHEAILRYTRDNDEDAGDELRKEADLINACHNYLSDIVKDASVKELLKEFLK